MKKIKEIEKDKITVGQNIYSGLKKNNVAVWAISIVSISAMVCMFIFSMAVYEESKGKKIYLMKDKGDFDMIPLSLLNEKKDRIKLIKFNAEYFIKLLYELDQYNISEKKEAVLWLVGKQPTDVLKDKERKQYWSRFKTYNGMVQKVQIDPESWEIIDEQTNPKVSFDIFIKVINDGGQPKYYQSNIRMEMEETVSIKYPANPFGYIITNYEENLKRMNPKIKETKIDSIGIKKFNQ